MHPDNPEDGNSLALTLTSNHFPYRDQLHDLKVNSILVLARSTNTEVTGYVMELTASPPTVSISESLTIAASEYGELYYAEIDSSESAIEIDFSDEINWQLSLELPSGDNLAENELDDLYLILGYAWL